MAGGACLEAIQLEESYCWESQLAGAATKLLGELHRQLVSKLYISTWYSLLREPTNTALGELARKLYIGLYRLV